MSAYDALIGFRASFRRGRGRTSLAQAADYYQARLEAGALAMRRAAKVLAPEQLYLDPAELEQSLSGGAPGGPVQSGRACALATTTWKSGAAETSRPSG
jgi:hypothetical protein